MSNFTEIREDIESVIDLGEMIPNPTERWAHDKVWRVVCRCGRFSVPKAERQMAVDDWNL